MKITENKLRNIIRQIIKEEHHYNDDDYVSIKREEDYDEEHARARFTARFIDETEKVHFINEAMKHIAREVCDHLGVRRGSLSVRTMDAFWKGNTLGYVLVKVSNRSFAIIGVKFDAYIEEDYFSVVRVYNELRSAQAKFNSMK